MKNTLTRVAISIPENAIPVFEDALEPFVQSLLWSVDDEAEMQVMEGYSDTPPDEGLLSAAIKGAAKVAGITAPDVTVEQIKDRDWVAENLKQ
ncbi:MAG: hypothetical protein KAQ66_06515, partial [Rhodospirillaceae bacterium]|nr:hypothetical protein [Rhodospirillaceae bacterium]